MVNLEDIPTIFDKECIQYNNEKKYDICFILLKFNNIDIVKKIFPKLTDY